MDDTGRVRPGGGISKRRERISLVTGLLGLASAITLAVLLYLGRDYTARTEPGWWWNALVGCGLLTGLFWITSVASSAGRRDSPPAPPRPDMGGDVQMAPPHQGALHVWSEPAPSVAYEPAVGTPARPWEEGAAAPPWDEADEPTRWDLVATPTAPPGQEEPPDYGGQLGEYTAVYRRSEGGWVVEVEEVADVYVEASTLYQARERVVRALVQAGHPLETAEVVDDVELPPEAAEAILAAASDERALPPASALLVDELGLDETDAAALLGVSRAEVEKALLEVDPSAGGDEAGDDQLDDYGAEEVAVEHVSPYDAPASR